MMILANETISERITGKPETIGLKVRTGNASVVGKRSPAVAVFELIRTYRVQRQAAAVRMFLHFFRLCILAFEVGERHVQ